MSLLAVVMKMVWPSGCTAWETTHCRVVNVGGGAGRVFQDQAPLVVSRSTAAAAVGVHDIASNECCPWSSKKRYVSRKRTSPT